MKKEFFAFFLLVAILIASLINTYYINRLSQQIIGIIESAEVSAENEDWVSATKQAEKAADVWKKNDSYTHIVLRHTEIDSATDALYQLLKEIYDKNPESTKGAAKLAIEHLDSIASIEVVKPGSIF